MLQFCHLRVLVPIATLLLSACRPGVMYEEPRVKISGVVLDAYSRQPIPGVPVELKYYEPGSSNFANFFGSTSYSETKTTVLSDYKGYFSGYFPINDGYDKAAIDIANDGNDPSKPGAYLSGGVAFINIDSSFTFPKTCTLLVYPATKISLKVKANAWPEGCKSLSIYNWNPAKKRFEMNAFNSNSITAGDTTFKDIYFFSAPTTRLKWNLYFEDITRNKEAEILIESDWRKADKSFTITKF